MNNSFTIGGQIVDLVNSRIFSGVVVVENGKIIKIEEQPVGDDRVYYNETLENRQIANLLRS